MLLALTMATAANAERMRVETKNMSMILDVENGKTPQYVYFGSRLNASDVNNVQVTANGRMDAYPAYGMNTPAEAALSVRHSDGNLSTQLEITGTATRSEKGGTVYVIKMKDPKYDLLC